MDPSHWYRLDRRRLVAAGLGLVAASAIARSAAARTLASSSVSFPVTVETSLGPVTIDAAPRRIVALSVRDVDTVVALGVTPIGASRNLTTDDGISPWLAGRLDPDMTTLLDTRTEIPLEEIAGLAPDLIVATASFAAADVADQLNVIAPALIGLPPGGTDEIADRTALIGQALGLSAEAEAALVATRARQAQVATDYPELVGRTYTVASVRSESEIAVSASPTQVTTQLFQSFGMVPALTPADGAFVQQVGFTPLSWEEIALLEANILLLGYPGDGTREALERSPLFTTLTAPAAGRYLALPPAVNVGLTVPSVASVPWLVDQLDPFFATAAASLRASATT
ncbi:MAG TPA: ABC transporter substrate-binding protein [Thermomicrobiales bacterium]|jgi:iron complex transport system substrate-binding protein|nr:ABC transporter substrate-binding protein [Thermomicrobiales bacterium]